MGTDYSRDRYEQKCLDIVYEPAMTKVFISYSHDSRDHESKVLAFSEKLRTDGIETLLDQYVEGTPPQKWPRWMQDQVDEANFVLTVCTETYYHRFRGHEVPDKGKGVIWEGAIITQEIYDNRSITRKFVPVIFDPHNERYIPEPVRGHTFYLLNTEQRYNELLDYLFGQAGVPPGPVGPPKIKVRKAVSQFTFDNTGSYNQQQSWEINPFPSSRLQGGCRYFRGRKAELERIDDAWLSGSVGGTKPKKNMVVIDAWGGTGKTTLVCEWLARVIADDWRGADRFFDWSFYRQGSTDHITTSADDFFDTALRWLGEPKPEKLIGWAKGERLAALVAEHRTLFILDGLEPLQQTNGSLNDNALKAFVGGLVNRNPGLCIITTRISIPELAQHEGRSCVSLKLQQLDLEAGVTLLRDLGVTKGTDLELEQAVMDFRGHALALTLLGRYLAVVYDGEIKMRKRVPIMPDDNEEGIYAQQMMESYERWLEGKPESDILHLLGLFNGPVEGKALEVLRNQPVILGLTDNIYRLSDAQWKFAVAKVCDLGLLSSRDEKHPDILDCHPLVREYFASHLRTKHPDAWQEGHFRLYEYYKQLPNEKYPKMLADMMPLFRAVTHGCKAGLHQKAMDEVFWERIRQGDEHYSTQKLGAYGADQEALFAFFEVPWSKPADGMTDHWKGVVLIWAGELLRAMGRLSDAQEPMQASLDMAIRLETFGDAAGRAEILSDLLLRLGEIKKAEEYGRKSIEFADRNQDIDNWQRELSRSTLANALHQAGRLPEAEKLFEEVGSLRQQRSHKDSYPYSVDCFRLCDLLLSKGHGRKVKELANQSIAIAKKNKWPLGTALDHLSLGRACLHQAQFEGISEDPPQVSDLLHEASQYLEQAVQELRDAGTQHELPIGLLARSELHRVMENFAEAWRDLVKAQEIAEWGKMQLYLVDIHLEAARIFHAVELAAYQPQLAQAVDAFFKEQPDSEKYGVENIDKGFIYSQSARGKIREHVAIARKMIEQLGYDRRQLELAELEKGCVGPTF